MREIQKYRYIVAGILVVVVFSMGFLISDLVDDTRSQALRGELQEDLVEVESQQLQLAYLRSDVQSCEVLEEGLNNIVEGYNERLGKVQQYQQDSLLNGQRFETIEHQYVVSGIRYWLFAQELRERCEYSPNTVLFFTTDLEETDCPDCGRVGDQLTLLKKVHGKNVLIFSVPVSMEDGLVEILERQFNVTQTPTLVVNGNHTLKGYSSRRDVESLLEFEEG